MSATASPSSKTSPAEPRPRARLRAATRRVPRARMTDGEEGADEVDGREPELNMKLSRALFVMLLLHLVAIGGWVAFGFIKDRPNAAHVAPSPHASASGPLPARALTPTLPAAEASPIPRITPTPVAANVSRPPASRAETDALRLIEGTSGLAERTYLVSRGETLNSIAQKFKLSPDAVLKMNDIDDPRRIRVGQKLRLPSAAKTKS